ncbi:DUF4436 family protein [Streptomyces sp. NBC_01276]|uniref:DUF4436 family protein n=1 Tax=Streptomyces sp. NBC_01276 TaxID=2903808 RepID=UPI00352DA612
MRGLRSVALEPGGRTGATDRAAGRYRHTRPVAVDRLRGRRGSHCGRHPRPGEGGRPRRSHPASAERGRVGARSAPGVARASPSPFPPRRSRHGTTPGPTPPTPLPYVAPAGPASDRGPDRGGRVRGVVAAVQRAAGDRHLEFTAHERLPTRDLQVAITGGAISDYPFDTYEKPPDWCGIAAAESGREAPPLGPSPREGSGRELPRSAAWA